MSNAAYKICPFEKRVPMYIIPCAFPFTMWATSLARIIYLQNKLAESVNKMSANSSVIKFRSAGRLETRRSDFMLDGSPPMQRFCSAIHASGSVLLILTCLFVCFWHGVLVLVLVLVSIPPVLVRVLVFAASILLTHHFRCSSGRYPLPASLFYLLAHFWPVLW